MAKRSAQRLESSSDTDFGAVFKRIFKVDKTDTTILMNWMGRMRKDTAYNYVDGKLYLSP